MLNQGLKQHKLCSRKGQFIDPPHHTLCCCEGSRQRTLHTLRRWLSALNSSSGKMWWQRVVFKHHADAQVKKILLWKEESLGRPTAHQLVNMVCTKSFKKPSVKLLESMQKIAEFQLLITHAFKCCIVELQKLLLLNKFFTENYPLHWTTVTLKITYIGKLSSLHSINKSQ